MSKVYITDTVLRDAHQSLIATRLRTEDMLPICDQLDRVGYWSLEVWGGATFDACLRFLKEDPWERLRKLRRALPHTRLQMLLRGQNLLGYRHYSDDMVREFVRLAAKEGIDVFRIFDALNDIRNLETAIKAVKEAGKHAQAAICYTVSPVHTVDLYVEQALALVEMGADSIAIKDMAGLLTPSATAELISSLWTSLTVPLHIHSHATSGQAEMCELKAVEHGCTHIDTAISSFAGGTSHPATESMVVALRGTPHETGLDLELLQEIAAYFAEVRKKYRRFESEFTGVDTRVQVNQVPGGMMSNLAKQLEEQGALDRILDVFDEIPRVRRALGPEQPVECRPADLLSPELDKLRAEIGDLAENETDLMIYAMFPEVGRKFLKERREGRLQPEPLAPPEPPSQPVDRGEVPTEFKVFVHGEVYDVHITGANFNDQRHRRFYITLDGVPQEVDLEVLSGYRRGVTPSGRPVPASRAMW